MYRHSAYASSSLRSRKLKLVAACMAGSALLSACGSSASTSAKSTTSATTGATSQSSAATKSSAPVTITFWTAMSGALGSTLSHLVNQFNASQSTYKVVPTYKGSYPTVLSATIAAYRAHHAPDIAQIFDAGTATILDAKGVYVPVHSLMAKYKLPFATSDFIGGAASYYETQHDRLDSLPFNSSTPVLYYNKALFKKAGISSPPTTWNQVAADANTLAAHGAKCALTSSGAYVMWTDMEQFALWNGYHYATQDNGYKSIKNVKLEIDSKPMVAHLAMLGALAKRGLYRWNGVTTSTVPLFTDGTCAMYEQSSASSASISKGAKFPFGAAPLPIVSGDPHAPQNTVVGGASLWVLSGAPKDTYKGDAEFLHFLMSGKAQAYWAAHTGYVPVTKAGVSAMKADGAFAKSPTASVAIHELTNKPAKPWTRGIRLGYLPEIRNAEASAIASILAGKQTAAAALAKAQAAGDKILKTFASQYGG